MPSVAAPKPFESFTILDGKGLAKDVSRSPRSRAGKSPSDLPVKVRNVNVVKPVVRNRIPPPDHLPLINEPREKFQVRTQEKNNNRKHPKEYPPDLTLQSKTILDPRFSRHLDLKLRRLKEKEIIAERLSRRAREQPKIDTGISKLHSKSEPSVSIKVNVVNLEMPEVKKSRVELGVPAAGKTLNVKSPDIDTDLRTRKIARSYESVMPGRPMFVTTVKKGHFLPPPPEMATLLGLENYTPTTPLMYSYSSKPKVLVNGGGGDGGSVASVVKNIDEGDRIGAKRLGGAAKALAALTSLAAGAAGLSSGHQGNGLFGNLMNDRRIVRGITTQNQIYPQPLSSLGDGGKAAEARRRAVAKRRAPRISHAKDNFLNCPTVAVQTEPYLEELSDKVPEIDIGVQTDIYLEKPPSPKYVPPKGGCDISTQIEPGELFSFEEEVTETVDHLVGGVLQQAMAECVHEEGARGVRALAASAAEATLAAAVAKKREQMKNSTNNIEDSLSPSAPLEASSPAEALVRTHLPPILPDVVDSLREMGYLRDDIYSGIEENFMPWLMSEVAHEVESMITSKDVLTDIVKEVLETRAELYRAMGEEESGEEVSNTGSSGTVGSKDRETTPSTRQATEDKELELA